MTVAEVVQTLKDQLEKNCLRRRDYVNNGGENTLYLDGKINALYEALEVIDPNNARTYRDIYLFA